MKNLLNTSLLITSLAGLWLGLSSCTKSKQSTANDSQSTAGQEVGDGNTTALSAKKMQAGSQQAAAKVITINRGADPRFLDPQAQFDTASGLFVSNLYDTVLSYHYLKTPFELTPALARQMPTQPDEKTYVFELRKGVTFHDNECFPGGKGRELKASDVIYTIKRFADFNVNKSSYFLLEGMIEGLDELREASKKIKSGKVDYDAVKVAGLKVIDDYRFSITTKQKNPLILFSLASSALSIVPREAVEKYGKRFKTNPVGTGPFILERFNKKQTMVLNRNPNYWGVFPSDSSPQFAEYVKENAGKRLPLIDKLELKFIPEAQPAMLTFRKHGLDLAGLDRDNFSVMVERDKQGQPKLKDEFAKDAVMYNVPDTVMSYIIFNLKDPVFGKNKKLRQALAHAINVQEIIDVLRNGRGKKLNTPVPHPIAGNEFETGVKFHPYDPKKARELLAEAGYPGGKGLPELTIELRSTTNASMRLYEMYRKSFADIGVTLKANPQSFATFLSRIEKRNFQLADAGWKADYPDPENFYQLFYGPNDKTGSNDTGFSNAEFDRLFEQMRFMTPSPERTKILKRLGEIITEETPAIITLNPTVTGLKKKWIKNFYRNLMVNSPYKYLDVDTELKAKFVGS